MLEQSQFDVLKTSPRCFTFGEINRFEATFADILRQVRVYCGNPPDVHL